MDSADIDFVNGFDYTKGFRRFHIVWPLKKISTPMKSSAFETAIGSGDGKVSPWWSLGIEDATCQKGTWFGLRLQRSDTAVPVVFRLSVSSSTAANPILNISSFRVFGNSHAAWGLTKSAAEMKTAPEGEAIFHCWIDIPNTIVTELNNRKRKREALDDSSESDTSTRSKVSKQEIDSFTADIAKPFSGVLNGEGGYCSDVILAILKQGQIVRRFPCHGYILSVRSSVFERLFAMKAWKENPENGERLIEIDDIDEATMEMVLKHFYTAYLPDKSATIDQLFDLTYAADKYNLSDLKNRCFVLLALMYKVPSDRIRQLELADRHSLDQLKAISVSQLSMDMSVLKSEAVLDSIPSRLLCEIITALEERQFETKEIVLQTA